MPLLSLALALVSGFTNACTEVLQRIANVEAPQELKGVKVALYIVRQPLWLLGIVFMGGTLVVTAAALYFGSLSLVQPVLVTELIFTLALRRWWLRYDISGRSWMAAVVTCVGLAGFLIAAHPEEGHRVPTVGAWAVTLGTRAAVIVVLLLVSRLGSPGVAAALVGCAAGVAWSVDAAMVKEAMDALGAGGWLGLLQSWALYGAIVTGVVGTLLVQLSLHVGPLAASQPAIVITDPLASILTGVELYGEHLRHSPAAIASQVVMLAVMGYGIVLLSRWAPPQMEPQSLRRAAAPPGVGGDLAAPAPE